MGSPKQKKRVIKVEAKRERLNGLESGTREIRRKRGSRVSTTPRSLADSNISIQQTKQSCLHKRRASTENVERLGAGKTTHIHLQVLETPVSGHRLDE